MINSMTSKAIDSARAIINLKKMKAIVQKKAAGSSRQTLTAFWSTRFDHLESCRIERIDSKSIRRSLLAECTQREVVLLSENSHESDCPTSSHLLDGLAVKPSQDEKARVMHTLDYFLDLLIEPFLSCSHRSTQQTLTCSNKSIISIVRCADVTVKRAKIPLAGRHLEEKRVWD